MIEYTIVAAHATGLFDDVIVCTESEEIAGIARRAGAHVPELVPEELCGPEVASRAPWRRGGVALGWPACRGNRVPPAHLPVP